MSKSPGWLIGGPTGSGKSALALSLAREHGGEIVNADSMQVYRDLRILTARPTEAEEAKAPHHLFGVAPAPDPWSVGRWLGAARDVIAAISARGRPAIVVGGTGLYLRALTMGLADIPPIPLDARRASGAVFDALGETEFRSQLARSDPLAVQRIQAGDRQRLLRAWEVGSVTGRPLSEWQADTEPPSDARLWRRIIVDPPRRELVQRLDQRLIRMVDDGALDEVKMLIGPGWPPATPIMKALGVAPFSAHLRGDVSLAEAVSVAQRDTRRYAKRQATWFRHQAADWTRIDGPKDQTDG